MLNNYKMSKNDIKLFTRKNKVKTRRELREIVYNLFTTDYDRKMETINKNMRGSSKKIQSMLYNSDKLDEITQNATTNIVLNILTNGNKKKKDNNSKNKI